MDSSQSCHQKLLQGLFAIWGCWGYSLFPIPRPQPWAASTLPNGLLLALHSPTLGTTSHSPLRPFPVVFLSCLDPNLLLEAGTGGSVCKHPQDCPLLVLASDSRK